MKQTVRFKVPAQIQAEADRCTKEHACLSDPCFDLCPTEFSDAEGGFCRLLCEKEPGQCCPYRSDIGARPVCTCPVRQEIFRKYGV
ncbi:MAG: hypothetical protein G8D28_08985 [gamma proteobacterium symbiont of Phacoides pectinatus]